jgi:alkylation response protein AidB-like acyl-CoA dehydrogenase
VKYVQEREQFGRPLARFPTVQQELARMAGEVALIAAATQAGGLWPWLSGSPGTGPAGSYGVDGPLTL